MGSDTLDKNTKKSLVAIAWNGVDEPCAAVSFDVAAEFTILLFNFSGNERRPSAGNSFYYDQLLSKRTEFKGHLLRELHAHLQNDDYEYIGLVDDDIRLKISDINQLLRIATVNELDACQPSLTHNSYHSFQFNLHQPGVELLPVPLLP